MNMQWGSQLLVQCYYLAIGTHIRDTHHSDVLYILTGRLMISMLKSVITRAAPQTAVIIIS